MGPAQEVAGPRETNCHFWEFWVTVRRLMTIYHDKSNVASLTIVLKTGMGWPVQLGTSHSPGPVPKKNSIAL